MQQIELNRRRVMSGDSEPQNPPYLTFSSPNPFTLAVNNHTKNWNGSIEYSLDGKSWNIWDGTTVLESELLAGLQCILLRGVNNSLITGGSTQANWVVTGSEVSCVGDIRYLLNYNDIESAAMLAHCFFRMFVGCSALIEAPELPFTTLASSCYSQMFNSCDNLVKAPVLPAKILADNCYSSMFIRCYKLNKIVMLAIDISASHCLGSWLQDVSATGTFIKDPAMTTLPTGDNGIPSGWTVEDYPN